MYVCTQHWLKFNDSWFSGHLQLIDYWVIFIVRAAISEDINKIVSMQTLYDEIKPLMKYMLNWDKCIR